ncbi:uncharacterized protein LOC110708817 [Chenopodium quinoa]|uniref:uncharacterized protein LOC110708817 n=1 Tax=Chenopodium quinoa TaxID=63459 RepID=UPI000B78E2F8|nr:uncharacterized protein LOC110708817 [Chenopodium quinoa]
MVEHLECKHCKTWEEEMYWKHFNSMHFFQTLTPNFHDHLVLPEKFTAHMKSQLPDKVFLKSPSGGVWDIELLKSDDLLFVGNGWKDFVKVNELNEKCVLMFKFKRNSSFEVLIFDQGSSCEKCKHTKSEHEGKKRTAREASNTETIEDGGEEDSAFVVSKKSKKDDEPVVSSGAKVDTQAPRKRVLNAAAKAREGTRRILPCRLPIKRKAQSGKKSFRNETDKELSETSQRDVITAENGEISPEKVDSEKLESHSKKSLNKNDQISRRELIAPENGENSPTAERSKKLKGQPEFLTVPSGNHVENEPILNSEMNITTENEERELVVDRAPKLKPQSEKRPSSNGTPKEPTQILEKEMITPENGKNFPVTGCSNGFKGEAEKETSRRRGIIKERSQISGREVIRSNYKETSSEEDRSRKSSGKRRRLKKQEHPNSSKKLVFKSVPEERKSVVKEYMSNRRLVTEVEKEDALLRANLKQTEDSFIAVMQPTSVYRKFFLDIPAKWMQQHLPCRNQEVILRVGKKVWHTSLTTYSKKDASISTGWKKFALDNSLEESDVLVFKLVNQKDKASAVMDVNIFRVIEKTTPPLPVMS